jgi:hypothetical protein
VPVLRCLAAAIDVSERCLFLALRSRGAQRLAPAASRIQQARKLGVARGAAVDHLL